MQLLRPPGVRSRHKPIDWIAAAAQAAAAAALVCAMVWYTVARHGRLNEQLAEVDAGWLGLITLAVMLAAGGLLAFSFGKIDDAVRGYRTRIETNVESDE